jgi:hypothetical protein
MRTTYDIIEALKNNDEDIGYEELRYALLVYVTLFNHEHMNYSEVLTKNISEDMKQMRLQNSFDLYKTALKSEPKKFLGPTNDPANPEYQKRLNAGKKILDRIISTHKPL